MAWIKSAKSSAARRTRASAFVARRLRIQPHGPERPTRSSPIVTAEQSLRLFAKEVLPVLQSWKAVAVSEAAE